MKSFRIKTHRLETSYQQPHFLYSQQGIEQRKTAQPSLPELLCLPHRQPRGQGISLLALLWIVEVKILSLSPERLRDSICDY